MQPVVVDQGSRQQVAKIRMRKLKFKASMVFFSNFTMLIFRRIPEAFIHVNKAIQLNPVHLQSLHLAILGKPGHPFFSKFRAIYVIVKLFLPFKNCFFLNM